SLLAAALAAAPTTVLTNGTAITEAIADQLAAVASRTRYSLEVRVRFDDVEPDANDRVRGQGAWAKAGQAIGRLRGRRLVPTVTATEILSATETIGIYDRFRDFLTDLGIERPRVKIMPVFNLGRHGGRGMEEERLTAESLDGFDPGVLQCSDTRVVAD